MGRGDGEDQEEGRGEEEEGSGEEKEGRGDGEEEEGRRGSKGSKLKRRGSRQRTNKKKCVQEARSKRGGGRGGRGGRGGGGGGGGGESFIKDLETMESGLFCAPFPLLLPCFFLLRAFSLAFAHFLRASFLAVSLRSSSCLYFPFLRAT